MGKIGEGIIGIVAARLDKFNKPVILSYRGNMAATARSIVGFDRS